MASTYTKAELTGKGTLLKEDFTAGTEYQIVIIGKQESSGKYLFMESLTYTDTPLPLYFSGSVWSGSNAGGAVYDNYTQGINVYPEGTTEIFWTPAVDITGANVYFKAIGNIAASIQPA